MLASETPGEGDAFSGAVSAHCLTFDRLEAGYLGYGKSSPISEGLLCPYRVQIVKL